MAGTPRWQVRLRNEPPSMGSWQVVAGLSMLAARGEIELRYASTGSDPRVQLPMSEPWLEVLDRETGTRGRCASTSATGRFPPVADRRRPM